MIWAYEQFGNEVYTNLAKREKAALDWAEKQELNLIAKQSRSLVSKETWQKQLDFLNVAKRSIKLASTDEYNDFNLFREKVDKLCRDTTCRRDTAYGVSTNPTNPTISTIHLLHNPPNQPLKQLVINGLRIRGKIQFRQSLIPTNRQFPNNVDNWTTDKFYNPEE